MNPWIRCPIENSRNLTQRYLFSAIHPLIIDEVQYAPALFPYIKIAVSGRQPPTKI